MGGPKEREWLLPRDVPCSKQISTLCTRRDIHIYIGNPGVYP